MLERIGDTMLISMVLAIAMGHAYEAEPAALKSILEPGVDCSGDEDMTVQSFKNDVDINTIVRRFGVVQELPVGAPSAAAFGDFTGEADFHAMMNRVVEAQQGFGMLPARLRERFNNDPGKFMAYIHSSDNLEEAVELGILDRSALPAAPASRAADSSSGGEATVS